MLPSGRAMTVNLTRIYTRLGDDGETHLGDMSRVPKTHPRIEAYGTVDELNAQLGVALALPGLPERYAEWLRADPERPVRRRRRHLGPARAASASACACGPSRRPGSRRPATRSTPTLEPLKSFVLPGGTPAAAQLHVCRTVCRRAERRTIDCGDEVNRECVRYLNRLSDLLFILSRGANAGDEPLWEPGRYR